MSTRISPAVTVADLEALPDDDNRYELVEGELLVSRAPSLTHQRVSVNIIACLLRYLEQNQTGEVLPTPGVIFDEFNAVIPDVVYMSHETIAAVASGKHMTGAPDLAVEIVSPGAEGTRRDRILKRQAYAKFGVKEYWVADPESRTVEVYRLQNQPLELAATLTAADSLASPLLPGLRCEVGRIFPA